MPRRSYAPPFMRRLQRKMKPAEPTRTEPVKAAPPSPSLGEMTKDWEKKTGAPPVVGVDPGTGGGTAVAVGHIDRQQKVVLDRQQKVVPVAKEAPAPAPEPKPTVEAEKSAPESLEDLSKGDLRQMAKEKGIEVTRRMTKAELIEALQGS